MSGFVAVRGDAVPPEKPPLTGAFNHLTIAIHNIQYSHHW